jgi:hypothetical protein
MAAAAARQEPARAEKSLEEINAEIAALSLPHARAEKALEEIDAEIAALGLPDEPPAPPPKATLATQVDELFELYGGGKPTGLRLVELVGHLEAELVGTVDEGSRITDRIDALRGIFA